MPLLTIEVELPGSAPRLLSFDKDELVVGRSPQADVMLEDPQVSRVHCKLVFRTGSWRISDNHSANGVHLDRGGRGAPFLARNDIVVHGDVLFIAHYRLRVRAEPAAATQPGAGGPRSLRLSDEVPAGDDPTNTTVLVNPADVKDEMRQWLTEEQDAPARQTPPGTTKS